MPDQHYRGLIAEWYDDWLKENTADIEYYSGFFRGFEGRVLELACGTGRVLTSIAQTGVAIDGLDSSQDMLDVLRSKIANSGVPRGQLYLQSMQEFDLGVQYDAVFVAGGTFQLLISPQDAFHALVCIHRHLSEGGFFLVDIFVPWDDIFEQKREHFKVNRDVSRPDGKRSVVLERITTDIPKQVIHGTYRYEFYDQNMLTSCIMDDLSIRWYWKDEFANLLSSAGFSKAELLTESSLYAEGHAFVFKATK